MEPRYTIILEKVLTDTKKPRDEIETNVKSPKERNANTKPRVEINPQDSSYGGGMYATMV